MTECVILGEAWGESEAKYAHPFVGAAGQELWRMLHDAGFPCDFLPYNFVSSYTMTKRWAQFPYPLLNVFNCRPPDPENKNRAEFFYASLRENKAIDKTLPMRKVSQSNSYCLAEYAPHVHELRAKLLAMRPNLIVALGNTALWALGLNPAIGKVRGAVTASPYGKVLPVTHPAAVLRDWSRRTITCLDFLKAKRELAYPEIRTPARYIWTEPSIENLYTWWDLHGSKAELLAVDIETVKKTQISEVGFAASPTQALHIPFIVEDKAKKEYRNFFSFEDELAAWKFVRMVLASPIKKIGQNLKYDAYYFTRYGFPIKNWAHDTFVLAHCWQPELEKSLGFLSSLFLDDRSWKSIRKDVAKGEE